MRKDYSDKEIKRILEKEAQIPQCVEEKIQAAYREISMEPKVTMKYTKTYKIRKMIVIAAVVTMAAGLVGFAANEFLKVNISEDKENAKKIEYRVQVDAQKEAHKIEVTPTYMPEGYVYGEETSPYVGKWHDYDTDSVITITPLNAAELYWGEKTENPMYRDCFEKADYLEKTEIDGQRQDIFVEAEARYVDADKQTINIFLTNQEYGYMVWISGETTLEKEELLEVAKGLKIEVLDETEAYPTEAEIEAELAAQKEEQKLSEEEKEEKLKYGIPAENIYEIGDTISNPFLSAEYSEEDTEYIVEDIQIKDSLDIEEYPTQNYINYEEVSPWIQEDGTLKTHARYMQEMTEEGEVQGEPILEEVASKYVVVKMKVKNASGMTNEEVNLAPDLIVKETREDGSLSCYAPEFRSANEEYSLQWCSGEGASFPVYIDPMYHTEGIERLKDGFYRPLKEQEELEYTLVYIADEDVLDSLYLKFQPSYTEEMIEGKWTTNPYVKVTE
ncbi:hypothetical protein OCV51_06545 [Faecalicatena acetigenes]|uniref:DUF4367 domain-containing protein n=1 Tax=Faecalicatena acetigenes TaxID=2981790 RepID=A0ABT2TAK8_9FIRM|nr:hypothetical protein [Faecalicatena acetigenes]MCU6747314.1 hypothetical protein [Faecalicatena acetigenes]SCH79138.1 Uncharacterised protein [uncultured Clostridium sp.]